MALDAGWHVTCGAGDYPRYVDRVVSMTISLSVRHQRIDSRGQTMLECLVIGDSIAVGISHFRKECVSYARTGWTSSQWNKHYFPAFNAQLPTKSLIISLGTNDHQGVNTIAELNKIRENVKAGTRVFWVLPPKVKPAQREMVGEVAEIWGDSWLSVPETALARDKIHPTSAGYRNLAEEPTRINRVLADISSMKE